MKPIDNRRRRNFSVHYLPPRNSLFMLGALRAHAGDRSRIVSPALCKQSGNGNKTHTYSVDPSAGSVSANALTTPNWYDHRGEAIKTSSPGEPGASATGVVTTSQFDGPRRKGDAGCVPWYVVL
jgi:hypothetical protein